MLEKLRDKEETIKGMYNVLIHTRQDGDAPMCDIKLHYRGFLDVIPNSTHKNLMISSHNINFSAKGQVKEI